MFNTNTDLEPFGYRDTYGLPTGFALQEISNQRVQLSPLEMAGLREMKR